MYPIAGNMGEWQAWFSAIMYPIGSNMGELAALEYYVQYRWQYWRAGSPGLVVSYAL